MPAKRTTTRHVQGATQVGVTRQVIAKRTKRHLDELERTNYAEPSISAFAGAEDDEVLDGKYGKGRARQTISDKRRVVGGAAVKKKSSMNVRTALLYRKNLATLIDESGIGQLPVHIPTYLTAVTIPPREPRRLLCTVCGYWGKYKCRRCGMSYCDLTCRGVHNETRCEHRMF